MENEELAYCQLSANILDEAFDFVVNAMARLTVNSDPPHGPVFDCLFYCDSLLEEASKQLIALAPDVKLKCIPCDFSDPYDEESPEDPDGP